MEDKDNCHFNLTDDDDSWDMSSTGSSPLRENCENGSRVSRRLETHSHHIEDPYPSLSAEELQRLNLPHLPESLPKNKPLNDSNNVEGSEGGVKAKTVPAEPWVERIRKSPAMAPKQSPIEDIYEEGNFTLDTPSSPSPSFIPFYLKKKIGGMPLDVWFSIAQFFSYKDLLSTIGTANRSLYAITHSDVVADLNGEVQKFCFASRLFAVHRAQLMEEYSSISGLPARDDFFFQLPLAYSEVLRASRSRARSVWTKAAKGAPRSRSKEDLANAVRDEKFASALAYQTEETGNRLFDPLNISPFLEFKRAALYVRYAVQRHWLMQDTALESGQLGLPAAQGGRRAAEQLSSVAGCRIAYLPFSSLVNDYSNHKGCDQRVLSKEQRLNLHPHSETGDANTESSLPRNKILPRRLPPPRDSIRVKILSVDRMTLRQHGGGSPREREVEVADIDEIRDAISVSDTAGALQTVFFDTTESNLPEFLSRLGHVLAYLHFGGNGGLAFPSSDSIFVEVTPREAYNYMYYSGMKRRFVQNAVDPKRNGGVDFAHTGLMSGTLMNAPSVAQQSADEGGYFSRDAGIAVSKAAEVNSVNKAARMLSSFMIDKEETRCFIPLRIPRGVICVDPAGILLIQGRGGGAVNTWGMLD